VAVRAARESRQDGAVVVTGVAFAGDLIAVAEHLQDACLELGLRVAVAESCTGGLIAAVITEVPGSSGYFLGGVVSYANEAKEAFLDVPHELLERHGAVSREVAEAMARGARARFRADLAVGVTGVAGPDGGTPDKPVGLVYIGIATPTAVEVIAQSYRGDRSAIRQSAAFRALGLLHTHALQADG
jgi:nicotinamide-nucleotide amidase